MNLKESILLVQDENPVFGSMFYARLFRDHPDMQPYFQGVSMEHQAALLTMQLSLIEVYSSRRALAAGVYLQVLGTRHKSRGIPEDAYPKFRDSLIASLEEFHGADWSQDLANEYRRAIDVSVKKMLEGYKERFHV